MEKEQILKQLLTLESTLRQLRRELEQDLEKEEGKVIGVFDGEFMVTKEGKKYAVPPNYASKTKLVVGDTLRLVGEREGQNLFKQIGRVARHATRGTLIKEGENWLVVCPEGRFKILPASIKHWSVGIGDEINLEIPADYQEKQVEWGAMTGPAEEKKAVLEATSPQEPINESNPPSPTDDWELI